MKKVLLVLCSLFSFALCSMAQKEVTLVCEREGDLSVLLTDEVKQEATRLSVSGEVSVMDLFAIDECSQLTVLDLSNALIDTIPEHAFNSLQLDSIYLPESLEQLNMNAIGVSTEPSDGNRVCVTVIITGNFPELTNPLLLSEWIDPPLVFRVPQANDRYVEQYRLPYPNSSDTYSLINPFIYSADMDTLYKAQMWGIGEDELFVDVEHIASYAFAYCDAQDYVFSERLESIDTHAFDYMRELYWTSLGKHQNHGYIDDIEYFFGESVLIFNGEIPPVLKGQVLYSPAQWDSIRHTSSMFCTVGIVAPDANKYLQSDSQWYNEGNIFHYRHYKMRSDNYYYAPNEEMVRFDFNPDMWYINLAPDDSWTVQMQDDGTALFEFSGEIGSCYTFIVSENDVTDTIASPIPEWEHYTIQFTVTNENGDAIYQEVVECNPNETIHLSQILHGVKEDDTLTLSAEYVSSLYGASPWHIMGKMKLGKSGMTLLKSNKQTSPYYDLQGRPVANPTRGIYIKEGRKVVIK